MTSKFIEEIGPIDDSQFPHLKEKGFLTSLTIADTGRDMKKVRLRTALVRILQETSEEKLQWCFSFIGPLEGGKNLTVLSFLSEHWPQVKMHLSEVLKEHEEHALGCSEIAFTAPHALISELLLQAGLHIGFNLKFCGWLVDLPSDSLLLSFKMNSQGLFDLPQKGVELGFVTSDDWDLIEFFSLKVHDLERIQRLPRTNSE